MMPELGKEVFLPEPENRPVSRRFFRATPLLVLGLALLACTSPSAQAPEPIPTKIEDSNKWVDPELLQGKDRIFRSVEFRLDSTNPVPGRTILMRVCADGEFRLISKQLTPPARERFLFNEPRTPSGCGDYKPVIELERVGARGEEDLVWIGAPSSPEDCLSAYEKMRAYKIDTSEANIQVEYLGKQTLNEDDLKPGDKEAEGYWKPCIPLQ